MFLFVFVYFRRHMFVTAAVLDFTRRKLVFEDSFEFDFVSVLVRGFVGFRRKKRTR